jgi:hypothetical protein
MTKLIRLSTNLQPALSFTYLYVLDLPLYTPHILTATT